MICRNLAGVALLTVLLAGGVACTKSVDGNSQADPAALAVARDENQIRALVHEQNTYLANLDSAKLSQTVCAKYRDAAAKEFTPPVPPMSDLAPPDLASKPEFPDALRKVLGEKFPTAPPDVIGAIVDAVVAGDQNAYEGAMRNLLKSLVKVQITKIDNVEVSGNNGTADLTITTTKGSDPPAVDVKTNKYVKEDGKWLDCDPPS